MTPKEQAKEDMKKESIKSWYLDVQPRILQYCQIPPMVILTNKL
jgi:hypothetical protein